MLLLSLMLVMGGCSELGYYTQAVKGQMEILGKRDSIADLLADQSTPRETRDRLTLVKQIRDFASNELGLPDNRSYRYYSELGRAYVVWNVLAAPQNEMELKTWCFPVAGCIAYKGYFSNSGALALERKLADQGYDTFLYGVSAYSTLGWFSDPVLDTFIDYPEFALAGTIFHELAHQVVYVKDDSGFNEAFATAVQQAGVEKWILDRHSLSELDNHLASQNHNDSITELVLEYRNQLEQLYANGPESSLGQRKQEIIEQMKMAYSGIRERGSGTPYYDWWFSLELNNAHFSSIATYHRLVPAFKIALEQAGSLAAFYEIVKEKAKLPSQQRNRWIQALNSG